MKKRIIAALAASLTMMALASTAGAAITITQAPAGPRLSKPQPVDLRRQDVLLTPHQVTDPNGNTSTIPASGEPIRPGFGWVAQNASLMSGFFKNSHGFDSITGTDTFSDSWPDNPKGTPDRHPAGDRVEPTGEHPGHASGRRCNHPRCCVELPRRAFAHARGVHPEVHFDFDRNVQDGSPGVYKKGSSLDGICSFTVVA